jgi:hypothetical protein
MLVMENFRKFSQMETFRKLSLQCSRIDFYLLIFYRNIYVSGNFDHIIYVFIVLSMFLETFRKFSSLVNVVPPNLRTVVAPLLCTVNLAHLDGVPLYLN